MGFLKNVGTGRGLFLQWPVLTYIVPSNLNYLFKKK